MPAEGEAARAVPERQPFCASCAFARAASLLSPILERGLLAPSMIAHLPVSKYRFGIPFHRLAEMFRAEGIRLDDGLMSRYAEHVGATPGCIVLPMAKEAKQTAAAVVAKDA